MNGGVARSPMDGDDYGDDEGDDGDMQPMHQPQMRQDHQPRMDNQRYDGNRGSQDQNRHRGDREHHRNNNNRNDRNDRGGDRYEQRFDRGGGEPNGGQAPRPQNAEQGGPPRQGGGGGEQFRRRDSFPQQQHEQPEFLRRPVRRPRREGGNGTPEEVNGAGSGPADETDRD